MKEIAIQTEYIKLDQFLKLCGVAQTGGHAKELVLSGEVVVAGDVCLQRGKKLRKQDVITVAGEPLSFVII